MKAVFAVRSPQIIFTASVFGSGRGNERVQEQAWQLEYITAPQALSRLILFLSLLDEETQNFAAIYGKLQSNTQTQAH